MSMLFELQSSEPVRGTDAALQYDFAKLGLEFSEAENAHINHVFSDFKET